MASLLFSNPHLHYLFFFITNTGPLVHIEPADQIVVQILSYSFLPFSAQHLCSRKLIFLVIFWGVR